MTPKGGEELKIDKPVEGRVERRILHVVAYDEARGGQVIVRDIRDALNGRSDHHDILTLFAAPPVLLRAEHGLDVPIGPLRRAGFDPRVSYRLYRALRQLKPALVVAHGGEPLKYLASLPGSRPPLVYFSFGVVTQAARTGLRFRLYRTLMHRVDVVAAISQETYDEAHHLFKVPANRLALLPNSRDPSTYTPSEHPDRRDRLTLLFVGHLTTTKRPQLFVAAVRELARRGHNVRAVVVGDGPLEDQIREEAHDGAIEVLGRRTDIPDILRSADIFVFTSEPESEGMPGVLIEAGMAGLPVVATRVPGATTVIKEGETGFVVPTNDFDRLVARLETLVQDRHLVEEMGAAARRRCESEFSLSVSAERWSRLVDRLVA